MLTDTSQVCLFCHWDKQVYALLTKYLLRSSTCSFPPLWRTSWQEYVSVAWLRVACVMFKWMYIQSTAISAYSYRFTIICSAKRLRTFNKSINSRQASCKCSQNGLNRSKYPGYCEIAWGISFHWPFEIPSVIRFKLLCKWLIISGMQLAVVNWVILVFRYKNASTDN